MPRMLMFSLAAAGVLTGAVIVQSIHWRGRLTGAARSAASSTRTFVTRHRWGLALFRRRLPASGNATFDTYRANAVRTLEEERREFDAFVERLRRAEDRSAFESFLADRGNSNGAIASR